MTTLDDHARNVAEVLRCAEDAGEIGDAGAGDILAAYEAERAARLKAEAELDTFIHEGTPDAVQHLTTRALHAEERAARAEKALEEREADSLAALREAAEAVVSAKDSYESSHASRMHAEDALRRVEADLAAVRAQLATLRVAAGAVDIAQIGIATNHAQRATRADHMSEDDESNIIVAGRQVPFVQVGMIVHPDDCLNCERDGNPLWCSALVCDIHDDDDTASGMMATLLFRNGERREEPCDELRRHWRVARDFDQGRVYTGRWGAAPRGSVWPVAEVNEEA